MTDVQSRFRRRRRAGIAAIASLTAVLAATAVPGPAAGAAPGPDTSARPAGAAGAGGPARTVTLITGDRVTVTPAPGHRPRVTLNAAPGRKPAGYNAVVTKDKITVTPVDAQPLIAAGRLDRRLFEVDRLLAAGYDDANRAGLPLIMKGAGAALKSGRTRALPGTGLTAAEAPKSALPQLWKGFTADPSARLWLDARLKASLDGSVPQIGAPAAWEKGLTGKGVKVAVLDSGVDGSHPDLKVAESRNFTTAASADDRFGHGTHVASVVAGSGAASGGRYRGVAPDATLVSGKVLDDAGEGQESWLIDGMTWAAREAKAKVVNLSMTCFCDSPDLDPVEAAVNDLTKETGTLFVAAAGDIPFPMPMFTSLPAGAEQALAVTSVDRDDRPATQTQGPRIGDFSLKPEIMAPGVGITAARAKDTGLGSPVDANYTRLSGTSTATPHVAGAAAILAQQHPDWAGPRLKSTLMASAKPLDGVSPNIQGSGRVDVGKAVTQEVSTSPPSVAGDLRWPDSGPSELAKKVTYTNSGAAPVDLDLTVALATADGKPVSGTLDRNRVTVPANGTADVTLTMRGTDAIKTNTFAGQITASTASGPVVRTPVTGFVEPPTTNLAMPATDRDGKPAAYNYVMVQNVDTFESINALAGADGIARARVPAGRYVIGTQVKTGSAWTSGFRQVYDLAPGAREIPFDARRTTPIELTNDQPGSELTEATATMTFAVGEAASIMYLYGNSTARMSVQPAKHDQLRYAVTSTWQKQGTTPEAPSPYIFRDYGYALKQIPADPALRTRRAEMARLDTTVRSHGKAGTALLRWVGYNSETGAYESVGQSVTRPFPGTVAIYLRADPKVFWSSELRLYGDDPDSEIVRAFRDPRSYRAGPQADAWNAGVLGQNLNDWSNFRDGSQTKVSTSCPVTGAREVCTTDSTMEGTLRLSRGDTVVSEGKLRPGYGAVELTADLPDEAAAYTLHESLTREKSPLAALSTRLDTVWTFRSAKTAAKTGLPLQVVNLMPAGLNENNQAAKGKPTRIPYWVERNSGAPASAPASLKVEASFDDGATWRSVPAAGTPGAGVASVTPPSGATAVSLRATATDKAGNAVTQTVIRAYGLA
ncbi:S8 family serine peptidase [Actinomadura xylanilytica]|uniref:S8 family serine peptidase n=1 Tax=Actinomadura xylanilytica TaxID=887459 RepID=UPI00255AAA2E|nr:S8 family serine peptidase [Actinomadura xylanilytica]MDL4773834.1 S8 family serine peptidase [Actinomadura xylanilytica]